MIRLIAKLGGFLGRKGDGEPGMKTLWLGLQGARDFVEGMAFVQGLETRHTDFYLMRWLKPSADEPEAFTGSGELGVCTTGEMTGPANVTVITSTSARTVQIRFDFRAR